ncbi:circadian clock protein KaiC [Aquibacillus sp. 3ASR75-11]|uniref:Circadian clock protein KaiC n=1 Tax=Terrihalobacillus insolitus TaxID=2950438 RepID=A0A9X4ANJ1_9BACI|nr:ATPase domain-containing protein [Terrihalobacillus insolitus]MDC3414991.1 circadian clock protein KaiC [Terrihalobacillus insolitus]MDC3425874.1 circadian clock protein KaiC [Terrihalobacillus insolitus]
MKNLVGTGVNGLDTTLYGGVPKGNTIIVEGNPGTGKTILGMQFLYFGAVQYNEPGLYITFEEFPDQIYQDMYSFGWDIRKLEQENKLRVITLTPQVLMEQIKNPDGLFQRLIEEIGCQRIVIDSISLFHFYYNSKEEQRKTIYALRNALRKYSLTSFLIKEYTEMDQEQVSFVNYLVDGVVQLKLDHHFENYRKRTLEVTKMRGSNIQEGEHLFKITEQGIYLLPALSMVEDETITSLDVVPTGIHKLDRLLGGGIYDGSSFIIDTNSKSNYRFLLASILANRMKAGENVVVLLSSLNTIDDLNGTLKLFDVDLEQFVEDEKAIFIEHYNRPVPEKFKNATINVVGLDDDKYKQLLTEKVGPSIKNGIEKGGKWFVYYDLNTIVSQRGSAFLKRYFAEEVANMSALGISILSLCNFKELGQETSSFIERTSNGVIRTWVDGIYQYMQITKTPNGHNSEPFVVENINEKPFIRLV